MYDPLLTQEMHRTGNLEGKVHFVLDGDRLQGKNHSLDNTSNTCSYYFLLLMCYNVIIIIIVIILTQPYKFIAH